MPAVHSASLSNPVLEFSSKLPKVKEEVQAVVNKTAPVLANELDRLFPNSDLGFNDQGLKSMVENGWVTKDKERFYVSDAAREASRELLAVGGFAAASPDDKNYVHAEELRNLVKNGHSDDKSVLADFFKKLQKGDLR